MNTRSSTSSSASTSSEDGIERRVGDGFTQVDLLQLAREAEAELESLHIEPEYSDDPEVLDFSGLRFPKLKHLRIYNVGLEEFVFRKDCLPELAHFSVAQCKCDGSFVLDLPKLESLFLDKVEVGDTRDFGPSLSRCRSLTSFYTHKFWGLGDVRHFVSLPRCTEASFWRSDDLDSLDLFAPALTDLDLQACYSLRRVRLHDQGLSPTEAKRFASRAGWGRLLEDGEGDEASIKAFLQGVWGGKKVTLINTSIGKASIAHLKQHPRVGKRRMKMRDYMEDCYRGYGSDGEGENEQKVYSEAYEGYSSEEDEHPDPDYKFCGFQPYTRMDKLRERREAGLSLFR